MNIISDTPIDKPNNLPPYFLGFSAKEAEETYKLFEGTLNRLSKSYLYTTGIDKEDLFGEALTGLAIAVKNRDYERSIGEFKVYATKVMSSHLNEYIVKLKTMVHVPSYIAKAHSYIIRLKALLCIEDMFSILLVKPEDSKEDEYNELIGYLVKAAERAGVTVEALIDRAEFLPAYDEVYIEEQEEHQDITDPNKMLVADLQTRMTDEELIIADGIMKDKSYKQIGEELGVSKQAVGQKIDALRLKLRSL